MPANRHASGQSKGTKAIYPKEAFEFDPVRDSYRCPDGQELRRAGQSLHDGLIRIEFQHAATARSSEVNVTARTHRQSAQKRFVGSRRIRWEVAITIGDYDTLFYDRERPRAGNSFQKTRVLWSKAHMSQANVHFGVAFRHGNR